MERIYESANLRIVNSKTSLYNLRGGVRFVYYSLRFVVGSAHVRLYVYSSIFLFTLVLPTTNEREEDIIDRKSGVLLGPRVPG